MAVAAHALRTFVADVIIIFIATTNDAICTVPFTAAALLKNAATLGVSTALFVTFILWNAGVSLLVTAS